MDRGGRLPQSLTSRRRPGGTAALKPPSRFSLFLRRTLVRYSDQPLLRNVELAFLVALFAATGAYGAVRGGHGEAFLAYLHETGDTIATSIGFGIAGIDVYGLHRFERAEVLNLAGVTAHSSLLLLDAEGVRGLLKRNPWIGEATVRKLYPDRLEIAIEERQVFALWQRDGKLHLIARDGSVLESGIGMRPDLPLVVGAGAERRAAAFVDTLARFPAVRAEVRAGVLVAERRWNLRLKNGIDVRLPEDDPAAALARLTALDREKKILSRDVTAIDLRVPGQVAVRLSDDAAEARAVQRQRLPKRKGADT